MALSVIAGASAPQGSDPTSGAPAGTAAAPSPNGTTTRVTATEQPANAAAPAPKTDADAPEGFASWKEAYAALQSGKTADPKAPATTKVETAATKAAAAGLDVAALAQEFAQNGGKLGAESMNKLAQAGISADDLKTYVDGKTAQNAAYENAVFSELAGGREDFKTLAEWANVHLKPEELQALEEDLQSGNVRHAKRAVQELANKYNVANGEEPQLVTGEGGRAPAGVKGYEHYEDFIKDLSNKKYKEGDPAFHALVERRMAVTKPGVL